MLDMTAAMAQAATAACNATWAHGDRSPESWFREVSETRCRKRDEPGWDRARSTGSSAADAGTFAVSL